MERATSTLVVVSRILLLLCWLQRARGDYRFEVRAHRYENSDSETADGAYCDCCSQCDIGFFFCLRDSGTSHDDNTGNCPRGSYEAGEVSTDSDTFNFGSSSIDDGVPNPMTFDGNVWPVSSVHKSPGVYMAMWFQYYIIHS